ELLAEASDHVGVPPLPSGLGMQRREHPVLSAREENVGRRARAHLANKRFAVAPNVLAGRVQAQGQVEAQARRPPAGLPRNSPELFVRLPLCVEMIAFGFLIVVASLEPPLPQTLGPLRPRSALALANRPKASVVLRHRVGFEKPAEGLVPSAAPAVVGRSSAFAKEAICQRLQNLPLERHSPAVVHHAIRAQGPELFLGLGSLGLGRSALPEFRNARYVHIELVPENAAGRRVRARIKRLIQKSREQRQRGDRASPPTVRPIEQSIEVREVACCPAPVGLERIKRKENTPAPRRL